MQSEPSNVVSPAPPALEAKPRKRRRALFWALTAAGALLAITAVAVLLLRDPILRYAIQREALARGVALDFGGMELDRGSLRLRRVRLSLVGVRGFQADIDAARIGLDGLIPPDVTRIEAQLVSVRVEGSAADRAIELSAWTKDHPDAFHIPVAATDVRVEWRERRDAAPWLTLSGGVIAPAKGASGATFSAREASLAGVSFGPSFASWTASASSVSLGFGKESPADAPIRVDIHPKTRPAVADIVLRPVTMADLGSPMGLTLPTDKATIEGTIRLELGERALEEAIPGTVSMTLRGWIPPHPKELGGIVFGDKTAFTSAFRLSEDKRRVTLTDSAVAAGAFKLKGSGLIERQSDHALITMDMKGAIPCADVARSAAASSFGSSVGAFVGDVARRAMEGSVNVVVHIEADTRDLQRPRIQNDVGVGCGIRGLPGIKLPAPGSLPKLPSLPNLPLPDLNDL